MLRKILRATLCVVMASSMAWAAPKKSGGSCSAWNETFVNGTLDPSRWTVMSGSAPGSNATNTSSYDPNNVLVTPGLLRIDLTQVATGSGYISTGGAIRSKQTCGYGTYQWTMRMSSTAIDPYVPGQVVSGSVSAGFIYVNNSQTEIDFEFSATDPGNIHLVNWQTTSNETSTTWPIDPTAALHVYKFVWTRGNISYYIDGNFVGAHTTNVPSAPAYFWINHWGTNYEYWGGFADTTAARHMYVTQASYTP